MAKMHQLKECGEQRKANSEQCPVSKIYRLLSKIWHPNILHFFIQIQLDIKHIKTVAFDGKSFLFKEPKHRFVGS